MPPDEKLPEGRSGGDIRPPPDPGIKGLREVLEARLDGMDRAINLVHEAQSRVPSEVDVKVLHLERLHGEKFDSVQVQFQERDVRAERESRDNKVAIDAALQAAKEAVTEQTKSFALAADKSEAAIAKQIDGIQILVRTSVEALNDKIADLKERMALIQGSGSGVAAAQTTHQGNTSNWVAGGALVVALIAVVVTIVLAVMRK